MSVNGHPLIEKKIRGLECCRIVQDRDDALTATFHVEHFAIVSKIIRPHRKPGRQSLDLAEREQLAAAGSPYRYVGRYHGVSTQTSETQNAPKKNRCFAVA